MSTPIPGNRIPRVTLTYFNARNRRHVYEFLVQKFTDSGITPTELAIRTGMTKAMIVRLLGQPTNLTADTMAELLFAISGEELQYGASRPEQLKVASDSSND